MNALPRTEKANVQPAAPIAVSASLRPKRRWAGHSRPTPNEINQNSSITFPAETQGRMPRMKRSGEPHQNWAPPPRVVQPETPNRPILEFATDFLARLADTNWAAAQFRHSY